MIMKPPPPRLPAAGKVTASAKPVATAASTALPPAFRISSPTALARALLLTTIASPTTGEILELNRHDEGKATTLGAIDSGFGAPATLLQPIMRTPDKRANVNEGRMMPSS